MPQVDNMMSTLDLDNSGRVDFREFSAVLAQSLLKHEGAAELELALVRMLCIERAG